MVKVGALVRVIYPQYAANLIGRVIAQESSGRWIVELNTNPLNDGQAQLILSLNESDFILIESD